MSDSEIREAGRRLVPRISLSLNAGYGLGFSLPNILFLWPVPIVTGLVALAAWRWLNEGPDARPFFAAIALFCLGYLGLVISTFPYIVPPALTIREAAAAPASRMFMLIGTLILLPVILGHTGFIYWIFRGKVREGEGYH